MRTHNLRALWFVLLLTLGLYTAKPVQAQAIVQSTIVSVTDATHVSYANTARFNNLPYDPFSNIATGVYCHMQVGLYINFYSNGRLVSQSLLSSLDTGYQIRSHYDTDLSASTAVTVNPSVYAANLPGGSYTYRYSATANADEQSQPGFAGVSNTNSVTSPTLFTFLKTR